MCIRDRVVGLASWSLQDTDKDDKLFSKYILRGAAFGVFIGMAYGVYDVNSGGDAFMSQNHEEGLLHMDAEKKTVGSATTESDAEITHG